MYAFHSASDQWIDMSQERMLQREIANETEGFLNASKVLNAALHAMAAHLYHYKTELQRLEMVLSDLRKHRTEMTYKPRLKRRDGEDRKQEEKNEEDQEEFPPIDRELQKIEQLASRLAVISSVSDEMEKKVQNILALLFNQIQAINDKTLQAILNASQQENRISQKLSLASHMLSRSMKRDSIAMKTIAIMTLVFLPGATFAVRSHIISILETNQRDFRPYSRCHSLPRTNTYLHRPKSGFGLFSLLFVPLSRSVGMSTS